VVGRRLKFKKGCIYHLKLNWIGEFDVLVQCSNPPRIDRIPFVYDDRVWFKMLAANSPGNTLGDVKGYSSLRFNDFDRVIEKDRVDMKDLPLYVGYAQVSHHFTKLLNRLR